MDFSVIFLNMVSDWRSASATLLRSDSKCFNLAALRLNRDIVYQLFSGFLTCLSYEPLLPHYSNSEGRQEILITLSLKDLCREWHTLCRLSQGHTWKTRARRSGMDPEIRESNPRICRTRQVCGRKIWPYQKILEIAELYPELFHTGTQLRYFGYGSCQKF